MPTAKWTAEDGREFDNEIDCVNHEATLQGSRTYWRIRYCPDLTETGCCQRHILVTFYTRFSYEAQMLIDDYCQRTYGRSLAYVQGASMCHNWQLDSIDKDLFTRHAASGSPVKYLTIGPRDAGLI